MSWTFEDRPCAICGSRGTVGLGKRVSRHYDLPPALQATVVRCLECGLVYPNPLPIPDPAQTQTNYGDSSAYFPHSIDANPERTRFYDRIVGEVEARAGGPGRLLDYGCGRGELLKVAASRGWDPTGVDQSAVFVSEARRFSGQRVLCGDATLSELEPGSFDAVTLVSVIQHVAAPLPTMTALARLLRPGGVVFIETMNHESLLYLLGDAFYRVQGKRVTTHLSPTFPSFELYGFSERALRRLLANAGLEVETVRMRGGVSKTMPARGRGLRESALRLALRGAAWAAQLTGRGQVLEAIARAAAS